MEQKKNHLLLFCCFLPCLLAARDNINSVGVPTKQSQVSCSEIGAVVLRRDSIPEQEAVSFIQNFYQVYTANVSLGQDPNNFVANKYMTNRLIEKIKRVGIAVGADPIIRAQDFNKDAIKTLRIKTLGNDWYMVDYKWNILDDSTYRNIPLKVIRENGRYQVDYITPEWNGSLYGDSLLCTKMLLCPIDDTHLMTFIKTFCSRYICEYCNMPENLNSQLSELRSKYFTPKALAQFKEAENRYESDGYPNYDLVIDYFDFDCLWIPSITYTQIDIKTYQLHYGKWGNLPTTITFEVVKQGKFYKIDNIRIKNK